MDPESKKFGKGPKELTGGVDLLKHYNLLHHYKFFCKKSLPSISDTHYLRNVVGDTDIRKGEGMQLNQLIENTSLSRETNIRIQPFDPKILREAFSLRETAPVELPASEKGVPTQAGRSKISGAGYLNKPLEKKRKYDGDEDLNGIHRHMNSKHKSSKIGEFGPIRIAA
ncbi:hypothetical protein CTI12_AA608130 [Artemisia annua]|uniref:Mediator of RNA polymerase II transcription subunit 19 n=1 Tax=Artemisia annua TaxID=35608 RepID=A0A2U1KFM7_ARTAN|nr:hypothetical protein CTI12_AA608130 [Artemisia annua]